MGNCKDCRHWRQDGPPGIQTEQTMDTIRRVRGDAVVQEMRRKEAAERERYERDPKWGDCTLAESDAQYNLPPHRREPEHSGVLPINEHTLAYATDGDGICASLQVREDFGCVQFAARE